MVSPIKRTWSPCGQTPVIKTSINHHQRLNLFGAVLVPYRKKKLKLAIRSYTCSLSGIQVILFLKQLLRTISGDIVLVWDNHPIHKRKLVKDFIAQESRLHVYWLPICAPELNPAEFVWTQLKSQTANTAPLNLAELRKNISAGIAKIRNSQDRLLSCLTASDLSWK